MKEWPGELRLSQKFRKSRSPPGASEFGQCRSIHSAPCFCFAALNRTIQLLHYMKERPGELRLLRKSRSPLGACEFGQCRSIHLAPCFCFAALNRTIQLLHYMKERPGELRLSRKFRKSRSPLGACEFGQCRSIHLAPCFCFAALSRTIQLLHYMKERPGELRLSRKFRKSRSPPGACEFGQCRSIHSAPCFCFAALNHTIQLLHYMKERRQGS